MRFVAIPLLFSALLACSKGHNKEVCKQAADHYGACVKKTLGDEMYQLVKSKEKEGIEQCTGDDKTVAMYEKCLPEKDCDKFNECILDYARANGP
ncbi:MAG: hypothetical protein H0V17_17150 [Deltaproteobacteria bacterium]|nr:hypothetical protein [Deltaproteobacteria bacterium]